MLNVYLGFVWKGHSVKHTYLKSHNKDIKLVQLQAINKIKYTHLSTSGTHNK